ncbi:uncharacterized protein LOC143137325 [Alosa pseudoharengus]|uniref:uncharacterized protein LOC143137325 n=1 Tax=Alosa pseudoharengus TaxID=34774 RepID=UPI003F89BDF3
MLWPLSRVKALSRVNTLMLRPLSSMYALSRVNTLMLRPLSSMYALSRVNTLMLRPLSSMYALSRGSELCATTRRLLADFRMAGGQARREDIHLSAKAVAGIIFAISWHQRAIAADVVSHQQREDEGQESRGLELCATTRRLLGDFRMAGGQARCEDIHLSAKAVAGIIFAISWHQRAIAADVVSHQQREDEGQESRRPAGVQGPRGPEKQAQRAFCPSQ